MTQKTNEEALDRHMRRFERMLPRPLSRAMRWTRQPALIWVRAPVSLLLVAGGAFSFLPVLGLWMAPLGLLLLAQDVPFLRGPMIKALDWADRRFRKFRRRRG
jgi:hypothetical protein